MNIRRGIYNNSAYNWICDGVYDGIYYVIFNEYVII